MLVRSTSALVLACALAAPASAEVAAAALAFAEAEPIIVTGNRERYTIDTTGTATRTETDLNDVPQAISIVTERQIDDQALRSIGDVLRNVPGAMIGQGEGHRDQVTLRGNNSTADFFVDGLRDDVQYYRGLYNLERVEILKGPNAMIFGRGGGGGVINRVTKRPAANPFARAAASLDSFGAHDVEIDLNQPLGASAALRLNAVYEGFENHRDVYQGDRIAANPTFAFTPTDATRFDLSYEYLDDERVVDRGVPSQAGRPLRGFRDTFFGDRRVNQSDFDAHIVKAQLSHRFSDSVRITSRLLYGDYDKLYQNLFPATAVSATAMVGVEAYRDGTQRENWISQTDLVVEAETGPLAHVLLAGFEYADQQTGSQRINGLFANPVAGGAPVLRRNAPLADPFVAPAIVEWRLLRSTASDVEVLALYAQDQVSLGAHFDLVAGIRYDRFEIDAVNRVNGQTFSRTDELWSPRLGLVFKPVPPVSLYASYSRSFLPQSGDQFTSLDLTAAALEPEKFDNYEIGAKWDIRPSLAFTAALYQLDRSNTRAADPARPGSVVLTGEQRSKGLELSLTGEVRKGWQLSAGYTLQDAEIRKTTAAAPAGREIAQVPRHQASLWTRYDLTPRLGLGGGVYHQSKSFASISNAVVLPSYTRVDAALFLALTDNIEAQINVENLLGERYFPTAHNDNNITTGAPTSVRGTIRFGF